MSLQPTNQHQMLRLYSPPTSYSAWVICPQGAAFRSLHQVSEDVVAIERRFFEAAQRAHGIIAMSLLVILQPLNAELFSSLAARVSSVLGPCDASVASPWQEGVDADERQYAGVLRLLVLERVILDRPPLILTLHGAQHAAALGETIELFQNGFFHQVRQLLDDETCPEWRSRKTSTPNSLLMINWIAIARRTDSSVGVVIASSYALV